MTAYKTCRECQRNLRPHGSNANEHPGTLQNYGRSLCVSCYRARQANGTLDALHVERQAPNTHCAGPCGRPLRKSGTLLRDHPGTVAHVTRSMCATCARKAQDADYVPAVDPEDLGHIDRVRAAQIDFHRGWRRRNGLDPNAPINLREIVMA